MISDCSASLKLYVVYGINICKIFVEFRYELILLFCPPFALKVLVYHFNFIAFEAVCISALVFFSRCLNGSHVVIIFF